ncbi:unnamed protein product [Ascophyllum nodosum]
MNLTRAIPCGPCLNFTDPATAVAASKEESRMQAKLAAALRQKKERFQQKFDQEMSFARVLLKLGPVRSMMHDIRAFFDEKDSDKSGRIEMSEMTAAMKALDVTLSEDEVATLFKMADFYQDEQLTLKQFIAVLAMGYVLDAIPSLLETERDAAAPPCQGRRPSNFNSKERVVGDSLELFTYAYLLFDKTCKGVISREEVMVVISETGQHDTGSMSILSQERWDEMDWDSNGDISFGEFVYAFTKWVDVEHGDEGTNNTGYTQCNKGETKSGDANPARVGGQARRKSSAFVSRRASFKAKNVGRRISSAMLGRASERSGDWSSRRWKDNGNVADEPSKLSPTPEATAEEAVSRE